MEDDSEVALRIRRRVIERLHHASASHLGSNMSMVEMLIACYSVINVEKIIRQDTCRDRVVVSKGHCAAVTYAVLEDFGILPEAVMDSYHLSGSMLMGHVSHKVPGVEHSTGALGHGLSVAVGMALGLKSKGCESRVLCLCGDGEIQEGSVWEALLLWSHLQLKNLVLLIDHNRISSITSTHSVINMEPLSARFEGLGFDVRVVDGHDCRGIQETLNAAGLNAKPTVVICETIKGKGIPFAENQPIWHYRTLDSELMDSARRTLVRGGS